MSASAFGAQITTTHTSVKVRPQAAPPPHIPAELISARNEFVSFQVVVHASGGSLNNVRATFNGLSGAGTIDASNVQLYREEYLNLTKLSFQGAGTGRWPDALVPDRDETVGERRNAFPFNVPSGESRVIWVDVLVPLHARPGQYQGAVLIEGDGLEQSVPVTLEVLDTELPSTSSVATAFLFHRDMSCHTHTGKPTCGGEQASYELLAKYQKLALEHRVTLSNTLAFPVSGDWGTFDARYGPWLDGSAPSRLPGARMTSAQYPTEDRKAPQGARFAQFAQHMKARGWLDRAYDYTGDEPPYGITFDEARSRLQAVKATAPDLRTLLTTTVQDADKYGLTQYLDLIVPVINHMDGIEAPYTGDQRPAYDRFLQDRNNGLWLYQSCMSHGCAFGTNAPGNKPGSGWPSYMVDASAARNRAMQWVVFLQRASGELYYETALALDTAWTDLFRFNGNGDGTLFYPGLPARIGGSAHVPLPSLRLKQIRQGMQDYEWLKKVADAGDPEFARRVARELIPSSHQVGDDGAGFEAARLRLIARWVQLTHPSEQAPKGVERCIPSDDPKNGSLCTGAGGTLHHSGAALEGRVGCAAAAGVPGAFALVALVGLIARRRSGKR